MVSHQTAGISIIKYKYLNVLGNRYILFNCGFIFFLFPSFSAWFGVSGLVSEILDLFSRLHEETSIKLQAWYWVEFFCVVLSQQRPTQQILSVLYSLWLTASSSPAAVMETFTSPTFGRLLLLSFHLHRRLRVNPSSGGRTPPQVRPAAGSSDSPRLDRWWFQTWGTREEQ